MKELKIVFFAQRSTVPADQIRAGARRPDRARPALCGTQQLSKYKTTVLSVASPPWVLSSDRIELCAVGLPTLSFLPILGSLLSNYVSHSPVVVFAYSCHTLIYITFLMYSRAPPFLDLLPFKHTMRCHIQSKRRLFPIPVMTHGFSSKVVAAVRARRLFPSTTSRVRGSSPVLPLGRKLD